MGSVFGDTNAATARVLARNGVAGVDQLAEAARANNPDAPSGKARKYALVERERRFLLAESPVGVPTHQVLIEDRYLRGTRLRLRRMTNLEEPGFRLTYKLTQKIPSVNGAPGLITTLYLSPDEYTALLGIPADTLRIYEEVTEEGSNQVALGRLMQVIELLVLVGLTTLLWEQSRHDVLRSTLFIMDGPLAMFGPPAKLHDRAVTYFQQMIATTPGAGPYLCGVEKTGTVADYASALARQPRRILHAKRRLVHRHP